MAQAVQLISRVMAVLESLADVPEGAGLAAIAGRTGLPKSTARRILMALVAEGAVHQAEDFSDYRAGPRLIRLAARVLGNIDLRREARPVLEAVSERLGASVFLSQVLDGEVICIDSVEHSSGVRFYVQVGKRLPLHVSAAAQAIVAFMDEARRERALAAAEFTRFTERTMETVDELRARLAKVARAGYAVCDEEMEPGVRAFAVPIPAGPGRRPEASICSIAVSQRANWDTEHVVPDLREAAEVIANRAGLLETAPLAAGAKP